MDKIQLKDKKFKLFIPQESITKAVAQVARQIEHDIKQHEDQDVLFVCILNGAFMFASELMSELNYAGTNSTGVLQEIMPIKENIQGKTLILLEDIIDTGFTMKHVIAKLKEQGAAEVKLATMLFKPESLRCDLKPDYVGIQIPPAFIVGHGLDYDGLGRAYRDIYVIDE